MRGNPLGIAERKEREKSERQEAILDAAEKIIQEKGFEFATMDEIAEEAEFSKGTLYLYFKNKSALYLAISERGSEKLNQQFREVLKQKKKGLDLIRLLGETYLKFVKENPLYFAAFSHYENIQDPEFLKDNKFAQRCEEHAREAMGYMIHTLEAGMKDGSIDDSYNPTELGVMIWASARGIVQMIQLTSSGHHFKVVEDIDLNMESMITAFLQLLEKGMVKR